MNMDDIIGGRVFGVGGTIYGVTEIIVITKEGKQVKVTPKWSLMGCRLILKE